jgi:RNA polymerase sigma-70 factor (ECF subfamily)
MQDFDDNELLLLLKKGSLEAYEILFEKYYKLLCLQAAILLADEAEAEDLVQELFIEIWDKKIYRQVEQSLKAYLYRAVRNKCINEIRRNKLSRQKLEEYHEYRLKKKEPVLLEQKELAANIQSALQEFPSQRLKAFTLVYMENKRYREAADEMGVSINSVKTHLKLALQVLRDKLEIFR